MESMRTKARPDAKNFAEVLHQEFPLGTATVCRGTQAALAEKNPKCFEAVPLKTDKYQALNGRNPAFFLEPERYKGTN